MGMAEEYTEDQILEMWGQYFNELHDGASSVCLASLLTNGNEIRLSSLSEPNPEEAMTIFNSGGPDGGMKGFAISGERYIFVNILQGIAVFVKHREKNETEKKHLLLT